jgi:hypothetical protein
VVTLNKDVIIFFVRVLELTQKFKYEMTKRGCVRAHVKWVWFWKEWNRETNKLLFNWKREGDILIGNVAVLVKLAMLVHK